MGGVRKLSMGLRAIFKTFRVNFRSSREPAPRKFRERGVDLTALGRSWPDIRLDAPRKAETLAASAR
jgi:hypothetical protein